MKRLLKLHFVTMILSAALSVNAQDIKLSGVVTDANKEPLIGVNVVQKGSTKGTVTDLDGNGTPDVSFVLKAPAKGTQGVFYFIIDNKSSK